ncbi:MAG: restriction endonuclease subunit S [Roseobacter sp.]
MNAADLLHHYARISEAPDAIPKLRSFVLDLAVRGKLVEQNNTDESQAQILNRAQRKLQEIASRTERLRWKNTSIVSAADCEKPIPEGWIKARVNDTGLYVNGLAFKPSDWKSEGTPIIRIQNLTNPSKEFNYVQGEFPESVMVRAGDLLVSWSATLEAFKWTRQAGVLNQHIFRVIPHPALADHDFLLLLLKNAIREMAESDHAHGLVMTHINRGPFLNHVVLIPPIAEQRRIVAKVDELMALCDRLEEARSAREGVRDKLTATSLARLTAPETTEQDFQSHARFALQTLPALTTRPDQTKPFRQTILNLAVRGKLVEQDPAEGSGIELMATVGSSRNPLNRTRADCDLIDFAMPEGWDIQSLDAITQDGPKNGLSPTKTENQSAPKAITLTATTSGQFNGQHFKRVDVSLEAAEPFWLQPNDLLFQRGNTPEYVGMAAIYDGPEKEFIYPDLIMRVRIAPEMNLRFVHLWCISPVGRNYLTANATGAQKTMPKINQGVLKALPIMVPPLAEQHRIVVRVDALMALCDRLETALNTADTSRTRLLEALLHEALAPDAASMEAAE